MEDVVLFIESTRVVTIFPNNFFFIILQRNRDALGSYYYCAPFHSDIAFQKI